MDGKAAHWSDPIDGNRTNESGAAFLSLEWPFSSRCSGGGWLVSFARSLVRSSVLVVAEAKEEEYNNKTLNFLFLIHVIVTIIIFVAILYINEETPLLLLFLHTPH